MDSRDRKRYIEEIFKLCKTDSILIINSWGMLERRICPFLVIVIKDVPPLNKGEIVWVTAVKMSLELIDVYIVHQKAFNYYNFILYFE